MTDADQLAGVVLAVTMLLWLAVSVWAVARNRTHDGTTTYWYGDQQISRTEYEHLTGDTQ